MNDCPMRHKCRDADDKYCCKAYFEKAQHHCYPRVIGEKITVEGENNANNH